MFITHLNRIQRIFQTISKPLDALLINNAEHPFLDMNFFYITGITQGIFEGASILCFPDGSSDLFVSELEAESAKHVQSTIHIYKNSGEKENLLKELTKHCTTLGINNRGISHHQFLSLQKTFPTCAFVDISGSLQTTRMIKDEMEIQTIKKSCKIADTVLGKIPEMFHSQMTENQLAAEIDYLMQKLGAQKPAFDTISSFGSHTAEPHYTHGQTRISENDFVLCDFGASVDTYNSDVTRTFCHGVASEQQRRMHSVVLEAQQKALDIIKPGVSANKVHDAVFSFIESTEFKGYFIHSTGHSLGLNVHDGQGFSSQSDLILQENMVLTVEPGVYIPGIGGVRIEDDIRVTSDGVELLTTSPRELIQI